ncbi:MAG: Negative regulator of sigma [Acidobacteriota bacterium]|jgi:hypothetical protein
MPAALRAQLAEDFAPVRTLASPWRRALLVLPLALVALLAAPVYFDVRPGHARLGWLGVWGLSLAQFAIGFLMVVAAMRESVPGRSWSRRAIAAWSAVPIAAVTAITLWSWYASPIGIRAGWWTLAGMCFAGSAATALPVVALSAILSARAYPTRPAIAGALLGAGSGLCADAGWRVFCHFSEPAHVLSAHLAAVLCSAAIGALAAVCVSRPGTRVR